MGVLPSRSRVIEEVVPVRDIDPITCKEKFKGDVDGYGNCLIRIRTSTNDPDKAELLKMTYITRSKPSLERTE